MTTSNSIWAGWASLEITPPLPCWMGGYGARTAPANAIHDSLYAHALALGSRSQPLLLILCDLIAVDEAMVQQVRQRGVTALPRATIWLGATHTHSGPNVDRSLLVEPEPIDLEGILAGIVHAAQDALAHMRPVQVGWASGEIAGVATNRDHPESNVDVSLDMLCFYDVDAHHLGRSSSKLAKPVAVFGSFPCHPTVLSAGNLAISADLPGAFRGQLGALLGGDTDVALATGAAGDISTRYTRREQSFAELERLGGLLAEQAHALISQARPLEVSVPVVYSTAVELEMKSPLAPELLARYTRTLQEEMGKELQAGNIAQARTLETVLQGLEAMQKRPPSDLEHKRQVEIAVARMGEITLVAIPGELYNQLGAEIRHGSGMPVLLLGYTNGYSGYLPTREAYTEIDYEVLMSPFAPGSGERLRDAVHALLKRQPTYE